MNEREDNKELIQRIAKTLRSHTEPYKEGAWERFTAAYGKPKKRVLQWPYWSAAAVLLLAMGVFWLNNLSNDPDGAQLEIVQHDVGPQNLIAQAPEPTARAEGPADEAVASEESLAQIQKVSVRRLETLEDDRMLLAVNDADSPCNIVTAQYREIQDEMPKRAVAMTDTDTTEDTRTDPIAPRLTVTAEKGHGLLDREPVNAEYAVKANATESPLGKWDLGLAVSPSLTSEQVNMGGGIAVAYRLSDKFSLGSGISIGQLGVGQNPNYEPRVAHPDVQAHPGPNTGSQGFVSDAKVYREETSVTSSVVALDIPFDLRYEVAKGFYTSVGVSYVAVLSEQRTTHFVAGLNERTLEYSNATGKNLASAVEAVFSSEKIAAQPLKGKGYTGFVNFSIGRKIPLSSKLSLAIEPYFKLPVGRLSRADMDFTNGGIRIVTGF